MRHGAAISRKDTGFLAATSWTKWGGIQINSKGKTQPVGQLNANELGLHDLSGNVWEWCQDIWHDNYDSAPDNGAAWEKGGDDTVRVLRGGSWDLDNNHRSEVRNYNVSFLSVFGYSFRLAQD